MVFDTILFSYVLIIYVLKMGIEIIIIYGIFLSILLQHQLSVFFRPFAADFIISYSEKVLRVAGYHLYVLMICTVRIQREKVYFLAIPFSNEYCDKSCSYFQMLRMMGSDFPLVPSCSFAKPLIGKNIMNAAKPNHPKLLYKFFISNQNF